MILVLRNGSQELGRHFGEELRILRLQNAPYWMIAFRHDLLECLGHPRLFRIGVNDPKSPELVTRLQKIDDATVPEKSDRQPCNPLDGCGIVQGSLQRLADAGEKLLLVEMPLLGRDVLTHNQIADGIAVAVVPPRDRQPREKFRSVLPAAAKESSGMILRVRLAVNLHNRARQNLFGDVQDVARLSSDFTGIVAIDSLRLFVPPDNSPVEILDDDAALGRALENRFEELACLDELFARAPQLVLQLSDFRSSWVDGHS